MWLWLTAQGLAFWAGGCMGGGSPQLAQRDLGVLRRLISWKTLWMSPPHKHCRMNRAVRKERKKKRKENEIKELTDSTKHAYDVLWLGRRVQHLWFTGVRAALQSPALADLSWQGQVETWRNKDRKIEKEEGKTHQGGLGTHRLYSKETSGLMVISEAHCIEVWLVQPVIYLQFSKCWMSWIVLKQFSLRNRYNISQIITKKQPVAHWIKCEIFKYYVKHYTQIVFVFITTLRNHFTVYVWMNVPHAVNLVSSAI